MSLELKLGLKIPVNDATIAGVYGSNGAFLPGKEWLVVVSTTTERSSPEVHQSIWSSCAACGAFQAGKLAGYPYQMI